MYVSVVLINILVPQLPSPQTKIPDSTLGCHYFILEISTLYSLVILVALTLFTCCLKNVILSTQGLLLDFSNPPHHFPLEKHF